jgi:hypothetical protein
MPLVHQWEFPDINKLLTKVTAAYVLRGLNLSVYIYGSCNRAW